MIENKNINIKLNNMVKKKIPLFIKGIWYYHKTDEEHFYMNQNGMICYRLNGENYFSEDKTIFLLYTDIEDDCLTINKVNFENNEFFGSEITRIYYNSNYNELVICGEPIHNNISSYAKEGLEAANAYVQRIFSAQKWYKDVCFLNKNNSIDFSQKNVLTYLDMFIHNSHKMFPLILQYKNHTNITNFIFELMNGKTVSDYTKVGVITKKAINLAYNENIELSTALKASSLFNPQEISKFTKVLNYYKANTNEIINEICNIPNINFTKFANYLIRQSFIIGDFKMESDSDYNKTLQYVKMYADYINMTEEEENRDLYPENLKLAHDIAMKSNIINYSGKSYNVALFRKATKKYEDYAWEKDDYSFVIPTTPNDLIQEHEKLGHCVNTYIDKVIDERSKIVMLRYKGESYMTIEVSDTKIIQAKKKNNSLPNAEDEKLLELWANRCNLVLVSR